MRLVCLIVHLPPLTCTVLFLLFPLFQKDEVYLNLVLDYVPETVYRVARHFNKAKTTIPIIYVKVGTHTDYTRTYPAGCACGLSTHGCR